MLFNISIGLATISSAIVFLLWARIFYVNYEPLLVGFFKSSLCLISTGLLATASVILAVTISLALDLVFDIEEPFSVSMVLLALTLADTFFILAACVNYNYFQLKLFAALSIVWIIACLTYF